MFIFERPTTCRRIPSFTKTTERNIHCLINAFPPVCRMVHLHMDDLGFISQWRAILAGGLAGIAAALATYPLEVVETRLIAQNRRQPTYMGVVHTLSKIYRDEGLLALYRGFSLTVLGVCVHIHTE